MSEPKTKIACLAPKAVEGCLFRANALGQVYKQTIQVTYLGGITCEDGKMDKEMANDLRQEWGCYKQTGTSLYRRELCPRLKVLLLHDEVAETLLYGCTTPTHLEEQYRKLNSVLRDFFTRCIGWNMRTRTGRPLFYTEALHETDCTKTLEATARRRGLLFAGSVMLMGNDRLPKRVMLGTVERGEGYRGGQELGRMKQDGGGRRAPKKRTNGTARWKGGEMVHDEMTETRTGTSSEAPFGEDGKLSKGADKGGRDCGRTESKTKRRRGPEKK